MNVRKVIPCSYCKGVVQAINIAKKAKDNYPNKNIYILGMLVHNDEVVKELSDYGIITLEGEDKKELIGSIDDGVVIFSAHGTSDKLINYAKDKGLITIDAACEDVNKNRDLVKHYLDKDYEVIYFGKANHPESMAVTSLSNRIHLITNLDDLNKLNINNDKVFVTNQTTMSIFETNKIFDEIRKINNNWLIQKEICNATTLRQKAIMDLKDCDLLYVVGDLKSNNTNKLKEIALLNKEIKKVYLINSIDQINLTDLNVSNIYVTAGTSTPPYQIDKIINYLNNIKL